RLDGLRTDPKGYVEAPFGFPAGVDGLAFVGMPFQSKLASPLLGGVGEDARTVAKRIGNFVEASGSRSAR
ncbi:MAG: hypothetical protein Q8M65_09120, partial [Rhodoglobus sp.]|nr:hypothetical protein [Rhodoglobus sp.]